MRSMGHLPIPAVSRSSQCAAVPYAHHGSAVTRDRKWEKKKENVRNNICLFTSLRDLKAGEADLDIVGEINWTESLSVLLNSANINHAAMILT